MCESHATVYDAHIIFLSFISPSPHPVFKTTQKDPEGTRVSSIYSLSAIWKEEVVLGSPLNVVVGGVSSSHLGSTPLAAAAVTC